MIEEFSDNTGARVTVRLDEARPISAFTVHLADGPPVGRADFVDSSDENGERLFFHTEVDQDVAGRGLAGLLVRGALAESIRAGRMVVPVCPLFASHLKKHGEEFLADGGRFRPSTKADIELVIRRTRSVA